MVLAARATCQSAVRCAFARIAADRNATRPGACPSQNERNRSSASYDRLNHRGRLLGAARRRLALLLQRTSSVEVRVVERAADVLERQPELAADQDLLQAQQIVVGVEPVARRRPRVRALIRSRRRFGTNQRLSAGRSRGGAKT
jgi:hypothetical protein